MKANVREARGSLVPKLQGQIQALFTLKKIMNKKLLVSVTLMIGNRPNVFAYYLLRQGGSLVPELQGGQIQALFKK